MYYAFIALTFDNNISVYELYIMFHFHRISTLMGYW